ncbi:MAG: TonB-dependent receptor [Bacteroidales bacterium]|nr:TonB-dependent receptor [Bacteroides sp.]MCM1502512.1 TonB-dependent receptor [Bacteroidales bacterium]
MALVVMMFSAATAGAQVKSISGKVTDSDGEPLVAVTVYQTDNTGNGTATGVDGSYTISVPSGATITFSCLGYTEKVEKVGSRTKIDVMMEDDRLAIDAAEVVSIGYGSVAKRDLTGSVTKVDMGEVLKSSSTTFDQALTGRVAGVVVTTSDGALGSEANIVIRGNNSLTQSSSPLFIIDGFQSESSLATSLNSADIESIDILKDASATAIYGARGANGVIVITTKQGVEGKPKVNFSASWTGSKIYNKMELMNPYEFVKLQTEYIGTGTNKYLDGADGKTYTLDDYIGLEGDDWQDRLYRSALTQNYNISLSGGSKSAGNRYNVSLSVVDQDGIIIKSNFQRYQAKINFSQNIGKKVVFDVMANYARSVTSGTTPTSAQQSSSASGWLIYSMWGYRPVKPIGDGSDHDLSEDLVDYDASNANDYRFNPVKSAENEHRKTIVDLLNANASITYEIVDGLKFKATGAYRFQNRRREEFNGSQTYTGYESSPSGKGINGAIYWNNWVYWQNEETLTWVKHINNRHHLNLMAGISFQGETQDYKGVRAEQMTTEALGLNGLHTGNYQTVTPYQYDWRQMSAFGRINYNYKYKYYLTATFRADASSKFPTDNRWGYFPSVGASWNFNRENLLKNSSWLKNGKLRFSWGLTGNNRTSTPYDYYSQISTLPGDPNSYDYVFNGQIVSGYYPSNMANDKLKWETTEQYNVGIDLSFFTNDRIKITADWYLKNTRDLLLQATIPASSGYTSAMINIGSMQNKGFELTIETVNIMKRNFQWNTTFNIALNRNKVTALTNDQYSLFNTVSWDQRFNSQYPYVTQVGKPSGMMYGYLYDGTYKEDEFNGGTYLKDGVPYMTSVGKEFVRPGDPKYRDINGDGVIDDNDRTVIGSGQPLHTGGFGNTFYFFGFDVSIFFQWSYGNDILNANKLIFENGSISNLNQLASYSGRYSAENPGSDIPRVRANGMFVYSSRVVEDGSFLRLRNVSIGYTLPKSVCRKVKVDNIRFNVSADNIWTLTGYSGPDPEVSTRNSVLTPGFDWSAYPRAFGITGGVSFTF